MESIESEAIPLDKPRPGSGCGHLGCPDLPLMDEARNVDDLRLSRLIRHEERLQACRSCNGRDLERSEDRVEGENRCILSGE
jgi:hypothetical protein